MQSSQGGRAAGQPVLPHPADNPLPLVAGFLAGGTPGFVVHGIRHRPTRRSQSSRLLANADWIISTVTLFAVGTPNNTLVLTSIGKL